MSDRYDDEQDELDTGGSGQNRQKRRRRGNRNQNNQNNQNDGRGQNGQANKNRQNGKRQPREPNALGNTADDIKNVAGNLRKANRAMKVGAGYFQGKADSKRTLAKSVDSLRDPGKAIRLQNQATKLEKRAEKLRKTAKKVEKVAGKADKFAKLVLKLGKIITMVGFFILILILIIGLLVFLITGWGMLLSGFKEIAKNFFDACQGIFSGKETVVHDDEIVTTLSNIEQMGYDLYGYGFVSSRAKDANGKNIYYETDADGNKSLVESLKNSNAYRYITTYMISDNYAYYIKNHNFNFRSMTVDIGSFFGGIFDQTQWGSGLISLYEQGGNSNVVTGIRGDPYGVSLGKGIVTAGSGVALGAIAGSFVPIIGTGIGALVGGVGGFFFGNWNEVTSSIEVNRASKTLEISAVGLSNQTFSYKLDGWTGRYSMPLEFLLATHIATMAPDLSYKLATEFNTDVEILLYKADDSSTEGGVKLSDGTTIWNSEFEALSTSGLNGSVNKTDAAKIFKNYPSLVSQTSGKYECTGMGMTTDSSATITSVASANITTEIANWINNNAEEELMINSETINASTISSYIDTSSLTEANTYTTNQNDPKYYVRTMLDSYDANVGGVNYSTPVIEYHCKGKINTKDSSDETHIISYDIYTTSMSATDPSTDTISNSFHIKLEIGKKDETGQTCSQRIAGIPEGGNLGETCSGCADYLNTLYKATQQVSNSKFSTYVPYINCVTDHWYRNVYFTYEAMREHGEENNIVVTDEEYEQLTTERWTMYLEDPEGNPELYVYLLEDGEYKGEFSKKNGKYLICREVENKGGHYKFAEGGENTYEKVDFGGDFDLFLLANETATDASSRYEAYNDDSIEKFKVGKKAKTMEIGEGEGQLSTNWTAYTGDVNYEYVSKELEDSGGNPQIEEAKDAGVKVMYQSQQGSVVQGDDGLRGETNEKVKKLFLDDYYIYNGSEERAALIETAKKTAKNIINGLYATQYASYMATNSDSTITYDYYVKYILGKDYDVDNPDTYKRLINEGYIADDIIKAVINVEGGEEVEVTATIDEISGGVNLAQNSLTAFNILTNMHTLDAEYIYHDFKELVVELDYFDKEDLTEKTSEVMMFPVSGLSSAGWPDAKYDVGEEFYGTLIHSADDYKVLRAKTQKEMEERLASVEDGDEDFEDSGPAYSDSIATGSFSSVEATDDATCNRYVTGYGTVFKQFVQGDYRTSGAVPRTDGGNTDIASSGCGICSTASILTGYGYDVTPTDVANKLKELGLQYNNDGTRTEKMQAVLESYSVTGSWLIPSSAEELKTILTDAFSAGKPIIARVGPNSGTWRSSGGHFFGVIGEDNGTLYTVDSAGRSAGYADRLVNSGGVDELVRQISGCCQGIYVPDVAPDGSCRSSSYTEFEGYRGEEAVLAPVTGEVVKYGTVERTNMETNEKEDVGFIKIRVLGDNECTPGDICDYFNKMNGDWQGYDYFWEEYSDANITNHVLYIEGFDVKRIFEETGVSMSSDNSVNGGNIQALGKYIEASEDNSYSTVNKVPILLDEERMKELQEIEDKKREAPYKIDSGGSLYIKEGAVIGYTYKNDSDSLNTKEEKITTTDDEGNEVEQTYRVGNYMRLILRDKDDQVVENIEDYIELKKTSAIETDIPEELLFFLGVLEEGYIEKDANNYGVTVLKDGAGNTTSFGLTAYIAKTGKIPEMYPDFETHLLSGSIPKEEVQDVFVLCLEAYKERILEIAGENSGMSQETLNALIDLYHAAPARSEKLATLFKSKGSLSVLDFENEWGSNENYGDALRIRGHNRGILATTGVYQRYNGTTPTSVIEFLSETPWSEFVEGKDPSTLFEDKGAGT